MHQLSHRIRVEGRDFDFGDAGKIDCLVCHDTTKTYKKAASGGFPEEKVDLVKVAQRSAGPAALPAAICHFSGEGGRRGRERDLSTAMEAPSRDHDVHMGMDEKGLNFNCQDCHKTRNHMISGRSVSVATSEGDLSCEYCHTDKPHIGAEMVDFHLNRHTKHVACQTCHIPLYSKDKPTTVYRDWSTAGRTCRSSKISTVCPPSASRREASSGNNPRSRPMPGTTARSSGTCWATASMSLVPPNWPSRWEAWMTRPAGSTRSRSAAPDRSVMRSTRP